jgi:hypothetical protein
VNYCVDRRNLRYILAITSAPALFSASREFVVKLPGPEPT